MSSRIQLMTWGASSCLTVGCCLLSGTHDILKTYDSDGMAAQLWFTADAPDSRFFQSWDLDLVFDVLQVSDYYHA